MEPWVQIRHSLKHISKVDFCQKKSGRFLERAPASDPLELEMKYQFSPLNEDDLVECSRLYMDTFRHDPWNEDWNIDDAFNRLSRFLSPPHALGIKAVGAVGILGFLVGEMEQWNGSESFYLKEMCVSKNRQRSGLGKKLMHALQEELVKRDVSRIYLITQRETVPELFYRSMGFAANESLLIMGKSIEPTG